MNRIVRVTENGWEYEADQRHAEIIVEELKLQDAKAVGAPGEEEPKWEIEENEMEMEESDATRYRRLAARANFLANDRSDIQYAVKESCRRMAKPVKGDWKRIKKVGRYLKGRPRLVYRFKWQGSVEE